MRGNAAKKIRLLNADPGAGAGAGPEGGEAAAAGAAGAGAGQTPPPAGSSGGGEQTTDWEQRFKNQQQVNRDLESKLNGERDTTKAQMAEVAKLLGWEKPPADPAELAQQLTEAQTKTTTVESNLAAAQRQLAVFKAAAAHGGDASALLDSASFLDSIKDVDPADATKLGDAIKAAVESNQRFAVAPAAPGTPSFHGGPRTPPTPQSSGTLGGALAGHYAGK